ncbi:MAG: putative LPS assembly protein LptD [Bacteroidetes bacterium]|nr:putative LPS assembly protein LptD [Bacteroidota bacterium]
MSNLNPLSAQGITTASTKKDSVSNPSPAKKAINNPIHYEASDSIILRMEHGKALLYNKAKVDMDETELNANYIEVAFANKTLFAKGNIDSTGKYINQPIFKDGNDAYTSDSLRYNNESKKGMVYGLSLTQDEAHVQLKQVMKQPDGSLMGNSGKISTCSDPHPHFYLNASKIKVIPNNKVLFGAANLVLADIPTPLALPFGIAPMKKGQRNGLIMPNPGFNNSNNSFFLSNLGYYQGLGKFADAQFSKTNDFSINSRFGLDRKLLPGVTLNGNINIVTGNYNKRNSKDIQTLSKNEFVSSVNYGQSFLKNKVNLSASARHTQNVQTHDFRLELPNVNVGVSSLTPFAKKNGSNTKWFEQLRLSYNMNFTNSLNTKDTLIFSDKYKDVLATIQSAVKHSIPLSTNIKLFKGVLNVTPSANYQEKWLFKANTKSIDPLTKQLISKDTSGFFRLNNYRFSTGISTNIYGTFTNLNLGKIRSIRHTITPNVNFNYRPEIDGYERGWNRTYIDTFGKNIGYSLFEKYGGSDYVQRKGGAIGFSLSNNLQAKKVIGKDTTGKEKLEKANLIDQLMISGNYDLAADSLQWSDINLGFNTVIAKQIRIGINSGLSPYS